MTKKQLEARIAKLEALLGMMTEYAASMGGGAIEHSEFVEYMAASPEYHAKAVSVCREALNH